MNNNLYNRLQCALRSSNIYSLKSLYDENPDNLEIKFEYAKRLRGEISAGNDLFKWIKKYST